MAAPTLVNVYSSNFADHSSSSEVVSSVSWSAGNVILIIGITEDNANSILNAPTATGLTFAAVVITNTNNACKVLAWSATAAADGTRDITSTVSGNGDSRGLMAFVFSGSDGIGASASVALDANTTLSLTRNYANSAVVWVLGDWKASSDVTVTGTPAGSTQQLAGTVSGAYTYFIFSWGDQGAAGTTSYGVEAFTDGDNNTMVAVEIRGTAAAGSILRQMMAHHEG